MHLVPSSLLLLPSAGNASTKEVIKTIPDIIKAAATSNLGILALLIIVIGFVCYMFFRNAPFNIRVWIFIVVLTGVVAFGGATLQAQRQESLAELNRERERTQQEQQRRVQGLTLKLIFPEQRPSQAQNGGHTNVDVATEVNPYEASVDAFVQKNDELDDKLRNDLVRILRGAGGIALEFKTLEAGDKVHVVVHDGNRIWRSDDFIIPQAKLDVSRVGQ
jgi:hypothetical protein